MRIFLIVILFSLLTGCVAIKGNKTATESMFTSSESPTLEMVIQDGFVYLGSTNNRPEEWGIKSGSSIRHLYADINDQRIERFISLDFKQISDKASWTSYPASSKNFNKSFILGGTATITAEKYATLVTILNPNNGSSFKDELAIIERTSKCRPCNLEQLYIGKEYLYTAKKARAKISYYELITVEDAKEVLDWYDAKKQQQAYNKYRCIDSIKFPPSERVAAYLSQFETRADNSVQTEFSERYRCGRKK